MNAEMTTKTTWVREYAAWIMRYSDADEAFATMCAEASVKMQQEFNGDDVNEWESPQDCAEDELSCWEADATPASFEYKSDAPIEGQGA